MPPHPTAELRPSEVSSGPAPLDILSLTSRMRKGDEMAFREFHAAYFDRLARYLFVVSRGDEQAMRDALQESFRRIARHIRAFREEPVLWSWLTVVARSALADQTRKARRYLAFLDRFTRHAEVFSAPAQEEEIQGGLNEALDRHLSRLNVEDRWIVEQKYFEQVSVREIADRLATTEGAVESRLVRIRRKLRDGLRAGLRHDSET